MNPPTHPPTLDVRRSGDYEKVHRAGTVNIPLEELARRMHELPPRDAPLIVFDADPARANAALERIRVGGRSVVEVVHGEAWLQQAPVQSGPSTDRLWSGHHIVLESIEHARKRWGHLATRRALDLACGTGRDAVYMALNDLDVEGWDILPDALERCVDLAARNGVKVRTRHCDVEAPDTVIEPDRYDLIVCVNFLHRPLMPKIAAGIRSGGLLAYETFVDPQREQFGKPARETHVLRSGELPKYVPGWEILLNREGLSGPRRFAASLIARKP